MHSALGALRSGAATVGHRLRHEDDGFNNLLEGGAIGVAGAVAAVGVGSALPGPANGFFSTAFSWLGGLAG